MKASLWILPAEKNLILNPVIMLKLFGKLASDGEACARIGAILGGGSESEVEHSQLLEGVSGIIVNLREEVSDVLDLEGNLPNRIKNKCAPLPLLCASKNVKRNFPTNSIHLQ